MSEWPVELSGVVESVVTTQGPNERWNLAALGLHAESRPVTARTWGQTRTRRNFAERGRGYVQFTRDPIDFAEAALTVREEDEPVLESADAWVEVRAERVEEGTEAGTEWRLDPIETGVRRQVVPVTNRGYYAVVEATVAASRLDVDTYDTEELCDRLDYFETVAERCGGPRERAAFDRIRELVEW